MSHSGEKGEIGPPGHRGEDGPQNVGYRKCKAKGCEYFVRGRGYCETHYNRFKKFGDAREDEPFGNQGEEHGPGKYYCRGMGWCRVLPNGRREFTCVES